MTLREKELLKVLKRIVKTKWCSCGDDDDGHIEH
jgi:hypothetical protein